MPISLPKITVITPSYNQAQFLEQTILSVIGQKYSNLEYILMDGGSDDGSVAVIEKYAQYFTYWQSQKDNGQGAAINEGFSKATGDILCWLNSDDMLMPGALLMIARLFGEVNEPAIIFGNCLHFNEQSPKTRGSDVISDHAIHNLELYDYIIQPSSFWNRSAWQKNGALSEEFHFVFDWEWFIRARRNGILFVPIKNYLSIYRIHDAHKTGTGGDKRSKEIAEIYGKFNGEQKKKAFIKWDKYNNKYQWLHKLVYATNFYNMSFAAKIIHKILLPFITFDEYKNITRM